MKIGRQEHRSSGLSTSNADTIVVRVSGDHYNGGPQFKLMVDGQQVGTTQTVSAVKSSGQWQEFTFKTDLGADDAAKVEVVFTKLHAGGKFGGGSYNATGGLHGVGASVVNALSERLEVEVDREGTTWSMAFKRGEPEGPLSKSGKVAKAKTGTRVRYWADPQIFIKSAKFSYDDLITRARQTSFLVPGLEIVITALVLGVNRESDADPDAYTSKVARTVVEIFLRGIGGRA